DHAPQENEKKHLQPQQTSIPNHASQDGDHHLFGYESAAPLCDNLAKAGLGAAPCREVGGRAVPTPTRRGLNSSPALFLWESRTTNVDVMSVSNTTRPVLLSCSRNSERRRIQVVLPYGVDSSSAVGSSAAAAAAAAGGGQRSGGASRGGVGAGGEAGVLVGLTDPPNATALENRLNEARRVKRSRDLRKERHLFLSRLALERKERVLLEAWAASRIQALLRGFLGRPRAPRARPRQKLTPAESDRRLVADLQAILARAGLPTIPGLGPDGRKAAEGSAWGQGRGRSGSRGVGTAGGSSGGGGGLRRSRSRRQRAFEDEMSTCITKVVRGFLERRRFGRRWAIWDAKRRWSSAARIQHAWRAYRKRMGWRELESEVMGRAAATIQARWRGTSSRMALDRWAVEDSLRDRRAVSAVTIQTAARRRIAIARHGSRLTLGAARRKREARAAAEAARPRRRWNRGGPTAPASTAGGGASAEKGEKGSGRQGTDSNSSRGARPAVAAAADGIGDGGGGGSDAGRGEESRTATARPLPRKEGIGDCGTGLAQPAALPSKKEADRQHHGDEEGQTLARVHDPSPGVSRGKLGKSDNDGRGSVGEESRGRRLSERRARASQEASQLFVRDSVEAAVVNARRLSLAET
ncbi:unnamed protein product, partial [Scytosiphon promiscuus]